MWLMHLYTIFTQKGKSIESVITKQLYNLVYGEGNISK